MTANFNLGGLGNLGNSEQYLNLIRQAIQEHVPNAIYNQATQMNLANTALDLVVRQAVQAFAGQILNTGIGQQTSPLLAEVPGLLGLAQQLGLGQIIQQTLQSTDLDEKLRDAVIEGFSRYLRDNAGHLAEQAMQALIETAGKQQR